MTNAQVGARLKARINQLEALIISRRNLPDGVVNKSRDIQDAEYEIALLTEILGNG